MAPIRESMISIGALLVIDMVLGIWAALREGERWRSRKMGRTLNKMLVFQLLLISSRIMERWFLPGIPVVKVAGGIMAAKEFKSILENVDRITGMRVASEFLGKLFPYGDEQKPLPQPRSKPQDTPKEP